ncbi:MAG: 4-hydroxy-tetrahydrodipicolinate reductase [Bacteroidales bacterium]|jgi:4-hydroxy-tetrahydrodipicolinate reductase|nr:4-hydroxy-tetrahydrodipicolinate reductase [Bacteroidales bacterium]NLM93587.1 4-hydroxy-tetrahydrodipicolinate reductase [Bacteroidales bacterium]
MEKPLKIAIIGYGKMGHEIEMQALAAGHQIACKVDNENDWNCFPSGADVAIEFTTPDTAVNNIFRCFDAGVPVVCGTTGWHSRLPEVSMICLANNQTLFYASNFSPGVNILFEINRRLAELLNGFPHYQPFISETHHVQKLDAPSGTAIVLAHGIIDHNQRFNTWKLRDETQSPTEIPIEALRIDKVPGTHRVEWKGPEDTLEIRHTAHNRTGFARGALLAAQWVCKKKGVFTMKDLLNL